MSRICGSFLLGGGDFGWHAGRFPFVSELVPFGERDSLSRVELSLSEGEIPFRE